MFYLALMALMGRGEDSCWVCGCLAVFTAGQEKKKTVTLYLRIYLFSSDIHFFSEIPFCNIYDHQIFVLQSANI